MSLVYSASQISLCSSNWDLIQYETFLLSWERISRYHTSLGLKCEIVTCLIWISVFARIQNWSLIISLPQNPVHCSFISFRDVVKIVLFCIGLKGAVFLSIISNTKICCVHLQKLHLSVAHFHGTTG